MTEFLTEFSMIDFIEEDITTFAVNSVGNEEPISLKATDIIAQAMETAQILGNENMQPIQNNIITQGMETAANFGNENLQPNENRNVSNSEVASSILQNEKNKSQMKEVNK